MSALDVRLDLQREIYRRKLAELVKGAWSTIVPQPISWNWHLDMMCEVAEATILGQIRNLLVCVPPGSSKSLIFSTLAPCWSWLQDPATKWLCSTYGQRLSNKNAALQMMLLTSKWWLDRFGQPWGAEHHAPVKIRNGGVTEFYNTGNGFRISTSVEGMTTGQHADILLGDDLVKAKDANSTIALEKADDFWRSVMVTRRADPATTRRILIMQRLSDKDPAGMVKEEGGYTVVEIPMRFDPDRRTVISIPAKGPLPAREMEDPRQERGELMDPTRFPAEEVNKIAEGLGLAGAAAQLDQDPVPPGGLIFNEAHFKNRYRTLPPKARLCAFVDCTFKESDRTDYVVIQVWGALGTALYLVDEVRARMNLPKTLAAILEVQARYPRLLGIYIEDKANGPGVISTLQEHVPGIVSWSPGTASKVERAEAVLPILESGTVWFPADAPWFPDYQKELTRFPKAKHDDRVDATSMALAVLGRRRITQIAEAYAKAREVLTPGVLRSTS